MTLTSYATSQNQAWQRAGIDQLSTKSKTPVNFSRSLSSECGFEDSSLIHKDKRNYDGKKGMSQGENIKVRALVSCIEDKWILTVVTSTLQLKTCRKM